jgi:ATP-dependent DNA helicase DinG
MATDGEARDRRVEAVLERLAAGLGDRGEARPGQVEMARAVAAAVHEGEPVAVRAGTGTGKTWAYLAGALHGLWARGADGGTGAEGRVVVATATKALQDQLAGKDLPAVAAALKGTLTFAVLKGRSNYLCRQAASEAAREAGVATLDLEAGGPGGPGGPGGGSDPATVAEQVARLVAWAGDTATGDRADLDFEPHPAAWAAVSVGTDECPGARECPSGATCFTEAAYERARSADVVVVNLHLLGAHVAAGGHVLPDHGAVVLDEAHEAEDIFVAALGVALTPGRVRHVARLARGLLPGDRATGLARAAETLAAALEPLLGRRLRDGPAGEPAVVEALAVLAEAIRQEHQALRDLGEIGDHGARRDRAVNALGGLAADIEKAVQAGEGDVCWVEQSGTQAALRVAPVDVGPDLARVLWSSATPVLTSATLPPGVSRRLGLGPGARFLDVGSPFDYRAHALLYVPRLPDPRDSAHPAAAHAELAFLMEAAGGRTLALFTSWRAMEAARAALAGTVPFRLLAQNDLPKPALIDAFRDDESSCLLATMGFWQGVDVPGSSCSVVAVDRLPFPRPDDPLFEARRERAGAAAFAAVDLPHAATKLAQGVGRLVRTATDRGVVAVLDRRLAEKDYRRVLLDALPPMRRTRDRDEVAAFLAPLRPVPEGAGGAARMGA